MDQVGFCSQFDQIMGFERGRTSPETVFSDLEEWDSMSLLAVISMIDEQYSVTLDGSEIAECSSIGEVCRLIESKLRQ